MVIVVNVYSLNDPISQQCWQLNQTECIMNHRFGLLLSGVVSIIVLSPEVNAQTHFSTTIEKADQPALSMTKGRGDSAWSEADNLSLTPDQETEIAAIKTSTNEQLAGILTSEQLATFQAGQANGDDMRSMMRGLGLTSSQRSSVMGVMRSAQDEIMEVLTPEQRAQIEGENPRDRN